MKRTLFLFLFLCTLSLIAQQENAWFFLIDKPNAEIFLENPLKRLSQRAIDRRNNLQIDIDVTDVPVYHSYLDAIKNFAGISVLGKSKWLNAILIQGKKEIVEEAFDNLKFINKVEFANKSLYKFAQKFLESGLVRHQNKFDTSQTAFNYACTTSQIEMLNGDYLHAQGFTGKGQIMAVIHAGFPNVHTLEAFKRLRDNGQILGGYDFVERNTNFYTGHSHGTNVLSIIGGYLENEFVNATPDASFYLFRTENASIEILLEETLWVEAVERADSLCAGVITSSNRTLFSSSIMAGLIACLNQNKSFLLKSLEGEILANEKNLNPYLREAVYASANRYENSTDQHGYEIPNFEIALNSYISSTVSLHQSLRHTIKVYPNPVGTKFNIHGLAGALKEYKIQVFDPLGNQVFQQKEVVLNMKNISFLESGLHFV
jgi:hypothetical protein